VRKDKGKETKEYVIESKHFACNELIWGRIERGVSLGVGWGSGKGEEEEKMS